MQTVNFNGYHYHLVPNLGCGFDEDLYLASLLAEEYPLSFFSLLLQCFSLEF